jgi:ubiquinone/menaquinone biosynthesis C-methylase UbiE
MSGQKENPDTFTSFERVFFNPDYVDQYDKLNVLYGGIYSRGAIGLAEVAQIKSGYRILEAGAGTGTASEILANLIGPEGNLWATEISGAMIPYLTKRMAKFPNVKVDELDARDLRSYITDQSLTNSLDAVVSNFTYYYFYPFISQWFEAAYEGLRNQGKLVFNLTNFLGLFTFEGKTYNNFTLRMKEYYHQLLQTEGVESDSSIRTSVSPINNQTFESIDKTLREIGFRQISWSPMSLAVKPSQALTMMIEGFYQYGSTIGWSSALNELPKEQKMVLLRRGLIKIGPTIDESGESPTIMNLVATK